MEKFSLKDCKVVRKRMCKSGEICPFYHICYKDESSLDDDNILTLVACKNKYLMYKQGISSLKDADINLIEGSQLQYAQIMASRNNGLFYDLYPIKAFLKKLNSLFISWMKGANYIIKLLLARVIAARNLLKSSSHTCLKMVPLSLIMPMELKYCT